jgi:RNA polymerase sigma-70 factor (ECF subfamily)
VLTDQTLGYGLVGALRARDPRAAVEAWSLLSPLVWRMLGRFQDHAADRQDLCQEVFLRFFARIDELRNPNALRGFVIGICLGVGQNERRRLRVRRAVQLTVSGDLPDLPVNGIDPESCEVTLDLKRLLEGLSPADRTLFVMRYIERRDLPELACAHDLSLATVKRRLARTTRRIGARMRAEPSLAALAGTLLPHPAAARRPAALPTAAPMATPMAEAAAR